MTRNVVVLGVVSFLTDVSSEMIFTLLPLFLANVLGVGVAIIGVIEGIGESTATLTNIASGWLSDRLGRRKGMAVLGYGLSTLAKPFLYLAGAWGTVLGVRFADRVGKGIRTSPRDALLADSSSPAALGRSFGFHRGMDTLGAVVGLLGAVVVVYLWQQEGLVLARGTFQALVLIGVVPAVAAVLLLLLLVRERRAPSREKEGAPGASGDRGGGLGLRFKLFLAIMLVFTLGNSSDAFLVLRAQNLGASLIQILVLLVVFNSVYAMTSLPAGILSDRLGRRVVLVGGWAIYAAVYLGFALAASWWLMWLLFAGYGLYYGMTAGVARALVADVVAVDRRGTAYGLYHGVVGITALPASVIAGWLWQVVAPSAPFFFGAVLAAVATLGLLLFFGKGSEPSPAAEGHARGEVK